MTTGPTSALREQAREWGRALLGAPQWSDVPDRVTLITVSPAAGYDDDARSITLWLTIDVPAARSLPNEYAALTREEVIIEQSPGSPGTLVAMSDASLHRLLQGTSRASVEARWRVRHAEAIVDRLHRLDEFNVRANMLPEDALERIVRALWLDLHAAAAGLDAIEAHPGFALPVAGEAAAAVARLAVALEEGAYPPVELLLRAARETRIGKRLGVWVDDLGAAVAGDGAAARRVVASREQALAEVRDVVGERWRSRPWWRDPEAYALRAPR
jgi:hypothetical protein